MNDDLPLDQLKIRIGRDSAGWATEIAVISIASRAVVSADLSKR